jgi:signal transduction histidine kinase
VNERGEAVEIVAEARAIEPAKASGLSPETLARLRKVEILTSLSNDDLLCMEVANHVFIEEGEFIARQGEAAHFFWILLAGQLRIYQSLPGGREHVIGTVPAGAALGELPLLSNIPNAANVRALERCELLQFDEEQFWNLMTVCPSVRKAILGNMAQRFQKFQSIVLQQEKMASLGTLAAGLMHELNNPGAAAARAASQLRSNLLRMHELTARFSKADLTPQQKECMFELQNYVLSKPKPLNLNSLEQSDAEEALAEWLESADVENAWKVAPTLVAIGIDSSELQCARSEFSGPFFSDALSWLEALVSSMQLVATIEESIGRVSTLVKAVKSYAYEGKGQRQTVDINESIYATLVMLGHKLREKEIGLEKKLTQGLPPLQSECTGLNQVWTNLLDNAIDAVPHGGRIRIGTWEETVAADPQGAQPNDRHYLCVSIGDNGTGIPLDSQPHIFDPFYTTKPVGVGTGLGLGIVHRIIEQYGGTITFSSEPGNTEFRVRLPRERT